MITYLEQLGKFGFEFMELLAEAFGLPANAFDQFYKTPKETQQHRCKVLPDHACWYIFCLSLALR